MQYNQFCPIAKAAEILGERWTILILREMLMGGRRFNEIQRGLGDISPAILTARLKSLEADGMLVRRKISGQKGYEYYPTAAAEALLPLLKSLGDWGMLWARHTVLDSDLDAEFLMFYLERSVEPSRLTGGNTVIKFRFNDLSEQQNWWLLVESDKTQVCLKDPGRDVNVYFNCSLRTMHDVWMGDRSYREAVKSGDLVIEGEPALTRTVQSWLRSSIFAESPRAPLAA